MYNINYWDRLEQLHLFSLQRRRERYMIIYIWKIIHGLVPDVGLTYAPTNNNDGLRLKIPKLKGKEYTKKLMESSLLYHGASLYNRLPNELRSTISKADKVVTIDSFKGKLDTFLWRIPDQPGPPKDGRPRLGKTNSIIHQLPHIKPPTEKPSNQT